jgi:hypothetical protein
MMEPKGSASPKRNSMIGLAVVVTFAAVVLGFIFLAGRGSQPTGGGIVPESASETSTGIATTVSISAISTSQNGPPVVFLPQNFTVIEGKTVELVFVNRDTSPHELTIPALNVTTGIVQASTIVRLLFIPNEVGTFQIGEPNGRGLTVLGYATVVAP